MPSTNHESDPTGDGCRRHPAEVVQALAAREQGLTDAEVVERRAQYGVNQLVEIGGRPAWRIVWEQLFSALVALLIVAAGVSFWLGEHTDAIAILSIVILNTALGFYQDYRAEQALAALKRYDVPRTTVLRDGRWQQLPATELVPGDVIRIAAGDLVPADARLLEVVNLRAEESTLTGESVDVEKSVEAIDAQPPVALADQVNMIFKGTTISYGHGQAIVAATGMQTQLGRVAQSLQTVRHGPTPLQRRLGRLGRTLAVIAVVIVAIVFAVGMLRGESPRLMLMTSLSLAVAIVPEGLPAVATVALALGAMRMFRRRALVRRLPAVETLGSVTVICTDKTGTITENRMTATEVFVDGRTLKLSPDSRLPDSHPPDGLKLLLATAALCSDVQVDRESPTDVSKLVGQPTEVALVAMAIEFGWDPASLVERFPPVAELPFDSTRKRMTTVHRAEHGAIQQLTSYDAWHDKPAVAFTKGAVDFILDTCSHVWRDGEPVPLDAAERTAIEQAHDQLAARGHRILAVAVKVFDSVPNSFEASALESDMVFVGLVGLIDPPRDEVRPAVMRCRRAGIRPVMITGDHPLTATSIARSVDIASHAPPVAGRELASLSDSELIEQVETTGVFARVSPVDKLRIVTALEDNQHVVAMTGDGVNDAPALKKADIGVAMGIRGADVSKQAADMVLLDDNFATIVGAVEQGRIVYDNIRKFVQYTMTSNAGEVGVMLAGPLLGMPLPLLPLQILWINLVTDGLPGLALSMEPAERTVMHRPPNPPRAAMVDRWMWLDIVWIGGLMAAVSLAVGYWYWALESATTAYWRTALFTVLTLSQMGNVLAIRSSRDSLLRVGLFSNLPLLGAVLLTFVMQLAVMYVPLLQRVFQTTGLAPLDLVICLVVSGVVFAAIELRKLAWRIWQARRLRASRS